MNKLDCFGKYNQPVSKCEKCKRQVQCYQLWNENEKRKKQNISKIPWYKREDIDKKLGVCEACG